MPQKITLAELKELINRKEITGLDLSEMELNGTDFSGCLIKDVVFSEEKSGKQLNDLDFKGATLKNVSFAGAALTKCDFDGSKTTLEGVSFKNCKLDKCRFRGTKISWADFRYSEINNLTFEESHIDYCDFYRALFTGINMFGKSVLSNSSVFFENVNIRKDNLHEGKILPENKEAYTRFLKERERFGTGGLENDQKKVSNWNPDQVINDRFAAAANTYKALNGSWTSKGYLRDASWAYIKGRKNERRHLLNLLWSKQTGFYNKLKILGPIAENWASDFLFGYGESIAKTVRTYVLLVLLFAFIFYASPHVSLTSYIYALLMSFKNMVAMTDKNMTDISPLIDFLNIIQTTFGILIIGIFGYILGNKIRNNQ
jgi:hypothetical protein